MKPSHELESIHVYEKRLRDYYLNEKLKPIIEETRKARQEIAMSERIELGAVEFSAEFKDGSLIHGSPRIEILQDNMREVAVNVPDGKYRWVLILDLEKAEKPDVVPTIQQTIDRGWVDCPKCNGRLLVDTKGNVTQCDKCGDAAFVYWNLFVELGKLPEGDIANAKL